MMSPLARRTLLLTGLLLPAAARADALAERLRGGGLVLLLRHARTVPGTGDPPGFRLGDCATQRNLSDEGRDQARRIGDHFRAAGFPIGAVRTSAWCRCRETAALLGLAEPRHLPELDSFFADGSRREARTAALRAWIGGWTGSSNAVLVTHQVNITAATGVAPRSGEAVVVAPGGEVLGRLAP